METLIQAHICTNKHTYTHISLNSTHTQTQIYTNTDAHTHTHTQPVASPQHPQTQTIPFCSVLDDDEEKVVKGKQFDFLHAISVITGPPPSRPVREYIN